MKDKVKIRLQSSFAVGSTIEYLSRFADGHDTVLELDPGTTIEGLLLQLSSIGSPDEWDDMFLHVFVNGILKSMEYVLQTDDIVNIHIPISGG